MTDKEKTEKIYMLIAFKYNDKYKRQKKIINADAKKIQNTLKHYKESTCKTSTVTHVVNIISNVRNWKIFEQCVHKKVKY